MAFYTVTEYAKKRGISRQAIVKSINAGKMNLLPGIEKVEFVEAGPFGRKMYLLTYKQDESEHGTSISKNP